MGCLLGGEIAYAEHADGLSLSGGKVNVAYETDEGAVETGCVHVSAERRGENTWFDAGFEVVFC